MRNTWLFSKRKSDGIGWQSEAGNRDTGAVCQMPFWEKENVSVP